MGHLQDLAEQLAQNEAGTSAALGAIEAALGNLTADIGRLNDQIADFASGTGTIEALVASGAALAARAQAVAVAAGVAADIVPE